VSSKDIKLGEFTAEVNAPANGYIIEFDNKRIVQIARLAGAPNDKGSGVVIHKKRGEMVEEGGPVITIYAEKEEKLAEALKSAREIPPIVVEGMLIEQVADVTEV